GKCAVLGCTHPKPQPAKGGNALPKNRMLLVHFLLLVFLFGLFLERRACWRRRRRTRKLWCWRWSHPWLSQDALVNILQCLQGQFELRSRGQSRHALIIHFVIIAETFTLFQICLCALCI